MAKLPRKPKAPKAGASLETWRAYEKRLNDWKRRCDTIRRNKVTKKSLVSRLRRKAASM